VAGAQAALRGLDVARRALDREVTPVITPQGLVRYEGRLQIALRISILPQGKDPDDVIRADPDHWRKLVDSALPVLDYYVQVLTADLDLSDSKGKAEAVRRLGPILQEIGNEVERAHYLQQLARMVRVDERVLARQIATARPTGRRPPTPAVEELPPSERPSQREFHFGAQEHCLAGVMRYPSMLEWLNAQLAEMGMPPLAPSDFSRVENQQLLQTLRQTGGLEGLHEALDPLLRDYLDWLLEAAGSYGERLGLAQAPPEKLEEDILATALRLRQDSLRTRVTQLHFLQLDAQAEGREDVITGTGETVDQLEEELREVQRAFSRCFSLGRQRLGHVMNG